MNDPYPLLDRRTILFGREPDLALLNERVSSSGVTAVIARPQAGKTWFLHEFARRLNEDGRYLVGWAEAAGPSPDLMLRAIVDLYKRWISNATMVEQARVVWKQHRGRYLSGLSTLFAQLVDELLGANDPVVGKTISSTVTALNEANTTLKTSGVELPELRYDQARDLIRLVARISEKPAVLFLDSWDQADSAESEASMLRRLLAEIDDLPYFHIVVSLRGMGRAYELIDSVVRSLPGPALAYELPAMYLEDAEERDRLLNYLRQELPPTSAIPDEKLLQLVDGHPGVVFRWCRAGGYHRSRMKTVDDLVAVAKDAHTYRFDELKDILPALPEDE